MKIKAILFSAILVSAVCLSSAEAFAHGHGSYQRTTSDPTQTVYCTFNDDCTLHLDSNCVDYHNGNCLENCAEYHGSYHNVDCLDDCILDHGSNHNKNCLHDCSTSHQISGTRHGRCR